MLWLNLPRPVRLISTTAAFLIVCAAQVARAGPITPTYLSAGVQTPNFPAACGNSASCFYGTENFSSWQGGKFTSNFNTGTSNFNTTSFIRGTYSANGSPNWVKAPADQYGGTNGTLPYPELFSRNAPVGAYKIDFTKSSNIPGINYFGIWISALDQFNNIQFYNQGKLLYSFGSTDLQAALGACSVLNAYCGNPTTPFRGQNSGELYAYVNFFSTAGYFDQVVLYNPNGSGFESSNHSVAYISSIVASGTTFSAPDRLPSAAVSTQLAVLVPEPATGVLVISALTVLLFRHRRRRAGQAEAEASAPGGKKPSRQRRRDLSRTRPAQIGWPSSARSRFSN